MSGNVFIYIGIMAAVSYLIRVFPMALIRRQITNEFIKSFLYYVPYVTLSVMTFPAIISATITPVSGVAALVVGAVAAFFGFNLFKTALSSCAVVLLLEFIIVR